MLDVLFAEQGEGKRMIEVARRAGTSTSHVSSTCTGRCTMVLANLEKRSRFESR